jgi:hypothetical protein
MTSRSCFGPNKSTTKSRNTRFLFNTKFIVPVGNF